MKYDSQSNWKNFQKLHNKVNIEMRNVRFNGECFKFNDPSENWTPIKPLLGRNNKLDNVRVLSVNGNVVQDSKTIAEALNNYFINPEAKLVVEYGDEQCNNTDPLVIDDADQSSL